MGIYVQSISIYVLIFMNMNGDASIRPLCMMHCQKNEPEKKEHVWLLFQIIPMIFPFLF